MKEPRWLDVGSIRAIHASQIREHGGAVGLRDQGLLESALSRPSDRFHYESASDVIDLAAAYGFGLARSHPFADGNRRVAFQAMYVFLGLNGRRIEADEPAVVRVVLDLAAGELPEADLAEWLRRHTKSR